MCLTPQLFFVLDDSLDYAMKIDAMIDSLHKNDGTENPEEDSCGEDEPDEDEESDADEELTDDGI